MLPKSNQTIYDALDGFIGLYTYSFTLANLRLPLPNFFVMFLSIFHVYLSRLNPFGCSKLTTFVVKCKAYDDDKETTFLPHEPSPGFGGSSPSASISNEPPLLVVEPLDSVNLEQLMENIADSRGSPVCEAVVGSCSVDERMTSKKSSLAPTEAKVESFAYLTIFYDDEGLLDAPKLQTAVIVILWSLMSPFRPGGVILITNQRSRELLKVVNQMKGECEVLREMQKARDKEYDELKATCKAVMEDFDKNPAVMVLHQKIASLLVEVKKHKESLDRMLLESQKWVGYQENLANLESKVVAFESKKGMLEAAEALFRKESEALKCDRAEVVPYVAMELVHSDEMAMLVGRLVSSAIFYERSAALEEVAKMKEPFNLAKVKGCRPTYKKEHTKAGNNLVAATFPFISKVVSDPSTLVESLLSKKPKSFRRPTLTKTNSLAPSTPSQTATTSSAPPPNPMSLPLGD
nr:hypothetical protein [Tanacetum cinerariifolium]